MHLQKRLRLSAALLISVALVQVGTVSVSQAASVRVIDGDTLEIDGTTIRLHGIDAPEAGQTCRRPNGKTWPCGKQAIEALETLVSDDNVTCDDRGADGYGRTIGVCTIGSEDINAKLVSMGLAWAFRKYSMDYAEIEDTAHRDALGVWQAETITPWDFRAEKWAVAEQETPNGCPIKGNISDGGQIYHAPWSPWYMKTKISVEKGERWFCSEAEAVAAGWRAPRWGR